MQALASGEIVMRRLKQYFSSGTTYRRGRRLVNEGLTQGIVYHGDSGRVDEAKAIIEGVVSERIAIATPEDIPAEGEVCVGEL